MATELSQADILKYLLTLLGEHGRHIKAFNTENEIVEVPSDGMAVRRELTGKTTITIVLGK
jgi:hypothetical protein